MNASNVDIRFDSASGGLCGEARWRKQEVARREQVVIPTGPEMAAIQDFYARFTKAYESRDDAAVMSFISKDWQASDGTTLSDLQENLRRTFRTFDEISYRIENFKAKQLLPYHYQVDYDVTITSRIYKRNLKHEEKSSVSESMGAESSGKLKIESTNSGRFWYVK